METPASKIQAFEHALSSIIELDTPASVLDALENSPELFKSPERILTLYIGSNEELYNKTLEVLKLGVETLDLILQLDENGAVPDDPDKLLDIYDGVEFFFESDWFKRIQQTIFHGNNQVQLDESLVLFYRVQNGLLDFVDKYKIKFFDYRQTDRQNIEIMNRFEEYQNQITVLLANNLAIILKSQGIIRNTENGFYPATYILTDHLEKYLTTAQEFFESPARLSDWRSRNGVSANFAFKLASILTLLESRGVNDIAKFTHLKIVSLKNFEEFVQISLLNDTTLEDLNTANHIVDYFCTF